jgi:hypothetical protein
VDPSANDAPLGVIRVGVDGVDPRLGNHVGSLRRDFVVRGTDSGTPGHTTPGDTLLAPGPPVPRSRGSQTTSVMLPRLSVPACQLRAGGEHRRAGVFAG